MQVGLFDEKPKKPRGKGWGGRRAGAGRKPSRPGKRIVHRTRPEHRRYEPVHVTVRVVRGLPSLRELEIARAIGDTLRELAKSERAKVFRVCQFSIQDDHVHMLVEADDKTALSNGMKAVNIRLAQAVNRTVGRRGQVIQDRYHQHKLACPTETRRALVYVLMNFKKHRAARDEIEDGLDTRSTAHCFLGFVAALPANAPVAAAKTWLLRKGWTLFGPIHRHEGPAAARPSG
jgi:putative transposase